MGNICPSNAGGLYLETTSNILVENSTFFSNIAVQGGAMFIQACDQVEIMKCDMDNNTAGLYAGGMYINGSSNVLIASSTFEHNRAMTSSGSVVWASQSRPMELRDNYFAFNSGNEKHNAMFVMLVLYLPLAIS
jgi:parallel beta-helix repeat protein